SEIENICNRYTGQDILFARTDKSAIQPLASIYGVDLTERAIMQAGLGDHRLRKLADVTENVGFYDSGSSDAYRNVNTLIN
ncbi:MAG: hypothetical protein IKX95_09315, partial [Lachnospiraceae bacterium]|nr:hypothetical protein [Lachnospiraceae bacterium]